MWEIVKLEVQVISFSIYSQFLNVVPVFFIFFFVLFLCRWNIWWSRHVKMAPWLMRLDPFIQSTSGWTLTNHLARLMRWLFICIVDRIVFYHITIAHDSHFHLLCCVFVLGDFMKKPTGWRDWTRLNACLSAYFSRKSNRYRLIMFFCWTKKLLVHSFDFVWQVDVRYSEFRERRSHRRAPHTHSGHYWSDR